MHELKNHVEERAQDASATERAPRPSRTHRRRWVPAGLTAGLAASVAAAVLVLNLAGGAGSAVAGRGTAGLPATAGSPLDRISTVAYTLNRDPHGTVNVTIRDAGAERPDLTRLQQDLKRMGVNARVYQDDPTCQPDQGEDPELGYTTLKAIDFHHRDGAFTATIRPDKFPTGTHLEIVFPPLPKGSPLIDTIAFGLSNGEAPGCRHMFFSEGALPASTVTTPGEIVPDRS
ncbi:hypothetical protein [Streptomyces sp. NBC_00233]|uniref:hypothetical protein n=1 Tax=Streptomyces sp. NBC_00233 TaxID=2975686 RepID=UPI0022561B7A|nr:hypothetical protein [Streptomyces sp. NBC_00233]MCX5233338.1 hypothetical protein [Streptomyces sp. NBC_00233]